MNGILKKFIQKGILFKIGYMNNKNYKIPIKERALVLQGGGSLGAYEAGAYKGIYEFLSNWDRDNWKEKHSTFDIIAGTSIGAINSAVLVSYVIENQTYEGSAERLIDFWHYLSKESNVDKNPFFEMWWDHFHKLNKNAATAEAARRYYSAKEFAYYGVPNAFVPNSPTYDSKYFDPDNVWYRYSNEPLKRSLERFVKFPIATTEEADQPRLLLVAVDVAEGIPVTFDSHATEDGSRKSEYGQFLKKDEKNPLFKYTIRYDDGITADHVIASGSFPVNFEYRKILVENNHMDTTSSPAQNEPRKEIRYFWDGGLMTNTPLMQLVLQHRWYWYKTRGLKDNVPRLGICIVNLHPTRQDEIPVDRDGAINRNNDITFSDRSSIEESTLLIISDFVNLVNKLIKVSTENGVKKEIIDQLLDEKIANPNFFPRIQKYSDMLAGRFQIDELIRINRTNDEHTISNKIFDFSKKTIELLLQRGYDDATKEFERLKQTFSKPV
jgi:predicted acylesterase/phospholipase RssA